MHKRTHADLAPPPIFAGKSLFPKTKTNTFWHLFPFGHKPQLISHRIRAVG